jgi:hypothetical protein
MDQSKFFAKAKALIDKPKGIVVDTATLQDYIGSVLITPMGNGVIESVVSRYSRRINKNTYNVYTITITGCSIKRITTYEYTQWRVT